MFPEAVSCAGSKTLTKVITIMGQSPPPEDLFHLLTKMKCHWQDGRFDWEEIKRLLPPSIGAGVEERPGVEGFERRNEEGARSVNVTDENGRFQRQLPPASKLYLIGNYTQYFVITYEGKESEKE